MSASTAQQRAPWVLATLLLIQILLMSMHARDPQNEQSFLRTWAMAVLTPIVGAADVVIVAVKGTVQEYADLRDARRENAQLIVRVEELTAERNRALERASENELLKAQLGLPSQPTYRVLSANVVSRDVNLWHRRLTIDRGSIDGVTRNMPIATTAGIVGRVISVGPNYSVVQVITDKHAGVGATLQRSRAKGEVRGLAVDESTNRTPDDALCELKNVAANEDVEVGETVLTTGLDRIYPKGLVVGTVERIENDPNAPWHRIIVRPSAPVDRVEHVLVLLVERKDLQVEESRSR